MCLLLRSLETALPAAPARSYSLRAASLLPTGRRLFVCHYSKPWLHSDHCMASVLCVQMYCGASLELPLTRGLPACISASECILAECKTIAILSVQGCLLYVLHITALILRRCLGPHPLSSTWPTLSLLCLQSPRLVIRFGSSNIINRCIMDWILSCAPCQITSRTLRQTLRFKRLALRLAVLCSRSFCTCVFLACSNPVTTSQLISAQQ